MVKCEHCEEEMLEHELCDLGYGQQHVEYECPNSCHYIEYLKSKETK